MQAPHYPDINLAIQVQDSADTTRKPGDNRIVWEGRFCDLRPKWYQNLKVTRVAGYVFGAGAIASGCSARLAYVALVARPIVIQYTVRGLATTTVGLAILSVYCLLKHCWKDPNYLETQGKKAEEDIVKNNFSYEEIQSQYGSSPIALNTIDYNALFRDRIFDSNLTYTQIKGQLSLPGKEFSFALDESNKEELKSKLFAYLQESPSYTVTEREKEALEFSKQELAMYICAPAYQRLEDNEITYGKFIELVGNNLTTFTRTHSFSPTVAESIKEKAIEFFVKENLGTTPTLERWDAGELGISLGDLVQNGALEKDIARLGESLNYAEFRARHSADAIELVTDREKLKEAYLDSYRTMRAFKEDAGLFGFMPDKLLRNRFEEEMQNIHAFDELLFRLGTSVFTDGFLSKTDVRLKKLVIEDLKSHSYHINSKSVLNKFDLIDADVQQIINDALADEERRLAPLNIQRADLDIANMEEKEKIERDYQSTKAVQLAPLQEALEMSQRSCQLLAMQKENIESQITQLHSNIAERNRLIETRRNKEKNELMAAKASIQRKLEALRQVPDFQSQVTQLEANLAKLQEQLRSIDNTPVTGYEAASKAREQSAELTRQIQEVSSKKDSLSKKIQRAQQEGSEGQLEARLQEIEASLRAQETRREEIPLSQMDQGNARNGLPSLQSKQQEVFSQLIVAQTEREAVSARLKAVQNRLNAERQCRLETQEEVYNGQISLLNNIIEAAKEEVRQAFVKALEQL